MKIERVEIKGIRNTRDIAQHQTADGRSLKKGMLYRSGRLDKMSKKKRQFFLEKYNIKTIIDLRTQVEVNQSHDRQYPDTIDYYHIPVLNQEFFGITHEKRMSSVMYRERKRITEKSTGDDYMIDMYKSIVFDPNSQRRFRTFFDLLLEHQEGALLYHCTSGKDRTGIATMFILTILGVSEEDILEDYVASDYFNRTYNRNREVGMKILFFLPKKFRLLLSSMLYSKRIYMEKTIEAICDRYGSVMAYLEDVIGITKEKQDKLKTLFLE